MKSELIDLNERSTAPLLSDTHRGTLCFGRRPPVLVRKALVITAVGVYLISSLVLGGPPSPLFQGDPRTMARSPPPTRPCLEGPSPWIPPADLRVPRRR
jgi:hypothetical protein